MNHKHKQTRKHILVKEGDMVIFDLSVSCNQYPDCFF